MPTIVTRDPHGNVTSTRIEDWSSGKIEVLEEYAAYQYQPVDVVAPAFITQVLNNPIGEAGLSPAQQSNVLQLTSYQSSPSNAGQAAGLAQACEVLKYVPFLGPFLAGSCTATGVVVAGVGIYHWLSSFTESRYAVYFRGTLLTVLTAGAAQVFMENAKRQVRDQVRLRKAG